MLIARFLLKSINLLFLHLIFPHSNHAFTMIHINIFHNFYSKVEVMLSSKLTLPLSHSYTTIGHPLVQLIYSYQECIKIFHSHSLRCWMFAFILLNNFQFFRILLFQNWMLKVELSYPCTELPSSCLWTPLRHFFFNTSSTHLSFFFWQRVLFRKWAILYLIIFNCAQSTYFFIRKILQQVV